MAKNDINSNFNQIAVSDANDNVLGIRAAVGNVQITGGANGQVLSTNGSGTLSWASPSASSTPNFSASLSADFLVAASTMSAAINFNTIEYNNGSAYTSGTGKFTAPVAGLYRIEGYIRMVQQLGASLNESAVHIFKNNVLFRVTSDLVATHAARFTTDSTVLRLAANDTIDFRVYCGAAVLVKSGSTFTVHYVSA